MRDIHQWIELLKSSKFQLCGKFDDSLYTQKKLKELFYLLIDHITVKNNGKGINIAWIFRNTELTQYVFDELMQYLCLFDRVEFCWQYFMEYYMLFDNNTSLKFNHKHVPIWSEAIKKSTDIQLELFGPDHWHISALSEMYTITPNKAHFILYAAYMKNFTITTEVFRAYKNKQAKFDDLYVILKSPTVSDSLLTIPHIGRFIEHVSSLKSSSYSSYNIDVNPYTMLVPEFAGFFVG